MRILHVENDAAAASAVRKMLEGFVEDCVWTEFGEQAIELARQQDFDLVLLDIMLPDIDGYEVVDRLRSVSVRTPCLIATGLVDRDSEFTKLALGVGDHLIKPFSRQELIDRIQSVTARTHGPRSSHEDAVPAYPCGKRVDGKERRKVRRFATIKSARIDFGSGLRCQIIRMSHAGARLRLHDLPDRLPRSFMLVLDSGDYRLCRMCWRDGDCMGVKFIDQ